MSVAKLRQVHARKYSAKFAAFTSFATNIEAKMKSSSGDIQQEINDMYAHLVDTDQRWETRASFCVMIMEVILKTSGDSTDIAPLVLFLLNQPPAPLVQPLGAVHRNHLMRITLHQCYHQLLHWSLVHHQKSMLRMLIPRQFLQRWKE